MKKIVNNAWRFVLLWVCYIPIGMISGKIAGTDRLFPMTQAQQLDAGRGMLVVAAFFSAVLLYAAMRSAWRGIKLVAAIFTAYFGITVLLTQIESFVFLKQLVNILPEGSLPVLILDNTISTILFSPLVVFVAGKMKGVEEETDRDRLKMSPVEWGIKFVIFGIVYYFVYNQF
jgi:hypothetical protein